MPEVPGNPSSKYPKKYAAHGFTVASDVELPPLTELEDGAASDIRIEDSGIIDSVLSPHGFANRPDGFEIWWGLVGRFTISREGNVLLQRLPGVTDELLYLPVVGCVLAIAAHMKGRFLLHANALNIGGKGVLLMGNKGQGKSTLTAALLSRGHTLLSDDTTALTISADQAVTVYRGCLQLKLWPDSIAQWAGAFAGRDRTMHAQTEKRIVPAKHYASPVEHAPLSRIYLLAEGQAISTKKLSPSDSWPQIFAQSYAALFGEDLFDARSKIDHFVKCTALAEKVGVTRLERARKYEEIDDVAGLIEKDVEDQTHQSP